MTHHRKLVTILIASAVLSCMTASGAMYLATDRYQQAVQDSQIERTSYIINQYVNEAVWRRFAANVGIGARYQEDNIRKAVVATDRDRLDAVIAECLAPAVTSGTIPIIGVTIYQGDGTTSPEASLSKTGVDCVLSDLLAKREGNNRPHEPCVMTERLLSVVVPVGGIKVVDFALRRPTGRVHPPVAWGCK